MSRLVVAHPRGREPERAYAASVVLGLLLGLDHVTIAEDRDDVCVRLGDTGPSVRVADRLLGVPESDWLSPASLPRRPLETHRDGSLPVLYGAPGLTRDGDDLRLEVDVFGSAFFMVTRYEEAIPGERDEHGRFPARASVAAAEGFLDRPIVHEYAELLWTALREAWPGLQRTARSGGLRVSHDVDVPRLPRSSALVTARSLAGDVLRRRDPRLAVARLTGRPDPYDTFDELMDLSEQAGVRSAFYFMAGATDRRFDVDYRLDDPSIQALMTRIHERGHEIGLHPSYGTLGSPERLTTEFGALREACGALGIEQGEWGGRQHYLRWETPGSWQAWDAAGLDYDSTLTYSDQPGFRTGMCVDYPVFDLGARRELTLRERPLIVMEGTLFDYQRLDHVRAEGSIAHLRERCRRVGGDFTLLWHNSSLLSRRDRELYRRVIRSG